MAIGVGPVIMPGYLDRVQIVTRTGTDQVEISVFNRWAEPLEDGIARILAEEIGARVPTDRIVMFPWRGVVARVTSVPGGRRGDALRWARRAATSPSIRAGAFSARDGNELAFRRTTVTEPAAGPGLRAHDQRP